MEPNARRKKKKKKEETIERGETGRRSGDEGDLERGWV